MARGSAGLAVGAGAAIVAALVVLWLIRGGADPDVSQGQEAVQDPPAPLASEGAAAENPDTSPAEEVAPPRLDVVRVDAGGLATIAGSAPPGATLSLRLDGVEIAQAKADAAGQFATLLTLQPSDAPRLLGLALLLADGGEVMGPDLVALAPVVAAAETTDPAAQSVVDTPPVLSPPPAALLLTPEGVTVLQDGGATAQDLPLSIDSISYGAGGEVILGGKAGAGALLRIYLDDAAVADAQADAQGAWRATLADVAEGLHTLRADQIAQDGTVQSRFETPFKRDVAPKPLSVLATAEEAGVGEQPASDTGTNNTGTANAGTNDTGASEPAATSPEPATGSAPEPDPPPTAAAAPITITVQPGLTLWAIARDNFGEGTMYVQVFEANRDKIKDPDLIYPGQVFTVPKP